MAVYTELQIDQVVPLFRDLGLGFPRSLRAISAGIENTNYFVDTQADTYVLTLFERLTFQQLPFYLHLMKHLAARQLPVPDPIACSKGDILHELHGRPAVVVNRLAGSNLLSPDEGHCHTVGAMLARLHLAGRDYGQRNPNPRGLTWWHEIQPMLGQFVSDRQKALLADELAFQTAIASSTAYRCIPCGPVHADLFRDNVLFEGDRLTGILDFYFAGDDSFLFDLAVCLNDWCTDPASGKADAHRTAAFLGGYETLRKLMPQERDLMPALLRAAAFRFWLSRLWDKYLPREAALLKAHDPEHFERILRLRRDACR